MKKVRVSFILPVIGSNSIIYGNQCDVFEFKIPEDKKNKENLFNESLKFFKDKKYSQCYDLENSDKDSYFVSFDGNRLRFFNWTNNIQLRYRDINKLEDCFYIDYGENVFNYQQYEKANKYIEDFKTRKIKYSDDNVKKYDLEAKLNKLKKEVIFEKGFGFKLFDNYYIKFIEENYPEFQINIESKKFTISVNEDYCEKSKEYEDLYNLKIYLDKDKLSDEDCSFIDDIIKKKPLTKEEVSNIDIKYKHYKLTTARELEDFFNRKIHDSFYILRYFTICDKDGNEISDKDKDLEKGTYYMKANLFKSKEGEKIVEECNGKLKDFKVNLDNIIKNRSNFETDLKKLFDDVNKFNSDFFNKTKDIKEKLGTFDSRNELSNHIYSFKKEIYHTYLMLSLLNKMNDGLGKIKIDGNILDDKLFDLNDEKKRKKELAEIYNLSYKNFISLISDYKGSDKEKVNYIYRCVCSDIPSKLENEFNSTVEKFAKIKEEYDESMYVVFEVELDTSKMEKYPDVTEKEYKAEFVKKKLRVKKGSNLLTDNVGLPYLSSVVVSPSDDSRTYNINLNYFFNYFIDGEQVFDLNDERNIVTSSKKIKFVPTKENSAKINISNILIYLQRQKFIKEMSEKIDKANTVEELRGAFSNFYDIMNKGSFDEWTETYEDFKKSSNFIKPSIYDKIYEYLESTVFKDLYSAINKKYTDLKKAKLGDECKKAFELLEKAYQSVVEKYKGIIGLVKDIDGLDELNNKKVNKDALKKELEDAIEDKDAINKVLVKDEELYKNTILKYVNDILKISDDKMNELKNEITNGIVNIYNSAVQEMMNNINNSADIDSLKKLGYEDKNVISTELTNKVNSKDSNIENKKKKYSIPIDIDTYVDDIYNEYKKKESLLKSGHKNEDNNEDTKEKGHGSVQSSEETTKKDNKVKGNKTRCSNYKNKEQ